MWAQPPLQLEYPCLYGGVHGFPILQAWPRESDKKQGLPSGTDSCINIFPFTSDDVSFPRARESFLVWGGEAVGQADGVRPTVTDTLFALSWVPLAQVIESKAKHYFFCFLCISAMSSFWWGSKGSMPSWVGFGEWKRIRGLGFRNILVPASVSFIKITKMSTLVPRMIDYKKFYMCII